MNKEPLLEQMADAAFAAGEIERLIPRVHGPARNALERFNRMHATIKSQEETIAGFDKVYAQRDELVAALELHKELLKSIRSTDVLMRMERQRADTLLLATDVLLMQVKP